MIRICVHKCSACQEKQMDFRGAQTKGSLYTREAYHRATVHLKGVTHYTLQGKVCEKEYEQIVRTPFSASAGKPALWKSPLCLPFIVL